MMVEWWVRTVLLGLSGLAVGLSLWLAKRETAAAIQRRDWRRRAWFISRNVGRAIVVGLVAEGVYRLPSIPITWRLVLYSLGLLMMDAGVGHDLYDFGRRDRREGDA